MPLDELLRCLDEDVVSDVGAIVASESLTGREAELSMLGAMVGLVSVDELVLSHLLCVRSSVD